MTGFSGEIAPSEHRTEVQTFLIADIRGYSHFTQEHGDEAAAHLATRFAHFTREGVAARDGRVIELRGDEALAVFSSARQALRAAVDLQARFGQETQKDPSLPLAVGIGLDAGEGARDHLEEARKLTRSAASWFSAYPLLKLGELSIFEGEWERAPRYLDEGMAIARRGEELQAIQEGERTRALLAEAM